MVLGGKFFKIKCDKFNISKRFLTSTTMTTAVVAGATLSANASDLSGFSATYVLKADGKKGTATRTLIKNRDDYH